jgi:hypothetical protein
MHTENSPEGHMDFERISNFLHIEESDYILISFFELCFNDILNRYNAYPKKDEKSEFISNYVFSEFINLPGAISEKIFKSMDSDNDDYLNMEGFTSGLVKIYTGDLDSLIKISFKILSCSPNIENLINYKEVFNYLNYFNSEFQILNKELFEKKIQNFFSQNGLFIENMNYYSYEEKIRNSDSNIFIFLLHCLNKIRPFSENEISYFHKNIPFGNRTSSKERLIFSYTHRSNFIAKPCLDLLMEIKLNSNKKFALKRRLGNKNILKFDQEESKINNFEAENKNQKEKLNQETEKFAAFEKDDKKDLLKCEILKNSLTFKRNSTFDLNSEKFSPMAISNNFQTYMENTSNDDKKFHNYVYAIDANKKLKKLKLEIIDKKIFVYEWIFSHMKFILNLIIPLKGYIAIKCESRKIKNEIYYPFAFISKFGNSMVNLSNFFLCESPESQSKWLKDVNEVIGIKSFDELYIKYETLEKHKFYKICCYELKNLEPVVKMKTKIVYRKELKNNQDLIKIKAEIDNLYIDKVIKNTPYETFADSKKIYIVNEFISTI